MVCGSPGSSQKKALAWPNVLYNIPLWFLWSVCLVHPPSHKWNQEPSQPSSNWQEGPPKMLTISPLFSFPNYSGTPPYDHPVYKTTSLLRPYSFKPNVKTIESFSYFEDPVNATTSLLPPGFYGPTVVALTGFHCTV